jgi:hypothetical protein
METRENERSQRQSQPYENDCSRARPTRPRSDLAAPSLSGHRAGRLGRWNGTYGASDRDRGGEERGSASCPVEAAGAFRVGCAVAVECLWCSSGWSWRSITRRSGVAILRRNVSLSAGAPSPDSARACSPRTWERCCGSCLGCRWGGFCDFRRSRELPVRAQEAAGGMSPLGGGRRSGPFSRRIRPVRSSGTRPRNASDALPAPSGDVQGRSTSVGTGMGATAPHTPRLDADVHYCPSAGLLWRR